MVIVENPNRTSRLFEGIRRHLSSNYCYRVFILKREKKKKKKEKNSLSFLCFLWSAHEYSFRVTVFIQREKNSRLCIFFEPTTSFNHLLLCQYSFLPQWKPPQLFFLVDFRCFPVSSDDLAKCQWHPQMSRSVENIYRISGSASQKRSNWATVWRAKTADPQDEMPSNAHMLHLPRELSYCSGCNFL